MEASNNEINNKNGNYKFTGNPIKDLINLPKVNNGETTVNKKGKLSYKDLARFMDISERTVISWSTKENFEINHCYFIALCEFFNHKILPNIIREICKEAFYICPSEAVWCFIVLDDYHFTNVMQIVLFRNTAYRHFFRTDYNNEKYLFLNDCIVLYSIDNNIVSKCLRSHKDIILTGSAQVNEENKKYIPVNKPLFVNKQSSICRIPFIVEPEYTGVLCLSLDNRFALNSEASKVWKKDKDEFFKIDRVGETNEYKKNNVSAYNEEEIGELKKLLQKKYDSHLKFYFKSISALKKNTLKNDL